jgi:steroid delta-isomerase-like uncharacterized protein
MNRKQHDAQHRPDPRTPSALQIVSAYAAAMAARDSAWMESLRAPDFTLDFVHNDAAGREPLTAEETRMLWSFWFVAFPELDWEVTRTIAAENLVVIQWVFIGTHSGPLEYFILGDHVEPTGRTIQLRGASFYDVSEGLIQRETIYLDFATLVVELGVEL